MPIFNYKAKEGPSKIVEGTIEAENSEGAIGKLIRLGLTPINVTQGQVKEIKEQSGAKNSFSIFKRVRLTDLVVFSRQLSDLIDASVPILKSLNVVLRQTTNPYLKEIINDMCSFVKDGGSLSGALSKHPTVFSSLFVNLVRTGEVGGNLDKVLARLADYLEKEQETRNKIRSSLAYPILIIIVGVATVFVLLSFVIPRLTVMFSDLEQEMPFVTTLLMKTSDFFASYWWLFLLTFIFFSFYLKRFISSQFGRRWLDSVVLKIPLIKNFIKIVEVARFSRTLGTLVESGVTITTALQSVIPTINNSVLRDDIEVVAESVTNGTSLKVSLEKCQFFPDMAVNMISIGEETGRLERGLYKIAEAYEKQSDQIVKTMLSLLGPMVLIVVVIIVGFLIIAMLLPIFQMNLMIK